MDLAKELASAGYLINSAAYCDDSGDISQNGQSDHPRLVVWYNTRCPALRRRNRQRNKLLAAVRAGHISFRDINDEPAALAAYGASLDDVRRRLQATDESGRLIVGADVMVAIWRLTLRRRLAGVVVRQSVMLPVTRFAYDRFAGLLFAWNRWKGHW